MNLNAPLQIYEIIKLLCAIAHRVIAIGVIASDCDLVRESGVFNLASRVSIDNV